MKIEKIDIGYKINGKEYVVEFTESGRMIAYDKEGNFLPFLKHKRLESRLLKESRAHSFELMKNNPIKNMFSGKYNHILLEILNEK